MLLKSMEEPELLGKPQCFNHLMNLDKDHRHLATVKGYLSARDDEGLSKFVKWVTRGSEDELIK